MRTIVFSFIFTILSPLLVHAILPKSVSYPKITVLLEDVPFEQVLKKVSSQTNMSIRIDENLAQKRISGNFVENDVETFISKCLRGHNYTFVYDASINTMIIRTFGSQKNQLIDIRYPGTTDNASPLITIDLDQLRAKENLAYKKYVNNAKSIEPLTGLTIGAIDNHFSEENIVYAAYLSNITSTEPLTGITLQEIASIQRKEKDLYNQNINNPLTIELPN